MYDSITKDSIYRISLSGNNPLAGYLVVKTYGDKQKRRRMCCLDDIRQQVQEWDDDYCRNHSDFENRGINVLLGKNKEKTRPAKNYYHVYDGQGNLSGRIRQWVICCWRFCAAPCFRCLCG